jgi:hypothetical protein
MTILRSQDDLAGQCSRAGQRVVFLQLVSGGRVVQAEAFANERFEFSLCHERIQVFRGQTLLIFGSIEHGETDGSQVVHVKRSDGELRPRIAARHQQVTAAFRQQRDRDIRVW